MNIKLGIIGTNYISDNLCHAALQNGIVFQADLKKQISETRLVSQDKFLL